MAETYPKQWIRQAVSGAWGSGDALSSAVGALVGVIGHFLPTWGQRVNGSLWLIPLCALAAVTVFRFLFFAPYELWRRERDRANEANTSLQAIGQNRPFRFDGAQPILLTDSGKLGFIRLNHSNLGPQLVKYSLEKLTLEIGGIMIPLEEIHGAGFSCSRILRDILMPR